MNDTVYPDCIQELYQSEVLGEQLVLALIPVAKNDREKYHFATCLQFETETKARLRPFLLAHGIDLVEEKAGEMAQGMIDAYRDNSWTDFLAGIKPLVEQFLARFKEIAAAGDPEDQEILQSMVTHETAFLTWIEGEIAGEQGSLDGFISQLNYPIQQVASV